MNAHWSVAVEKLNLQLLEFLYGGSRFSQSAFILQENPALAKIIINQVYHHIPDMEHPKTLKAAKVSAKTVDVFICGFYGYSLQRLLSL